LVGQVFKVLSVTVSVAWVTASLIVAG
jgi:hypothetical protein